MDNATNRWRISPRFDVIAVTPRRVLLVSAEATHLFTETDAELLLSLRTSQSSTDAATHSEAALIRLKALAAMHLVLPGGDDADRRSAAYVLETGLQTRAARLSWVALTDAGHSALRAVFEQTGVQLADDAPVVVVTTDDYLQTEVAEIAAKEERPWLLARPAGVEILIGPAFDRDRSVCWSCVAHWLRPRRWLQAASLAGGDPRYLPQPAIAASPASTAVAGGLIASAALQLAHATGAEPLFNAITIMNTFTLQTRRIQIPARVRCRCGGSRTVIPAPAFWTNSLTGVASAIEVTAAPVSGLYHASCEYYAPFSQRGSRCAPAPESAFGQGPTEQAAIDSCLGEAVERYSSVWQGTEPLVLARYDDDGRFIHPHTVTLFSDDQYARSATWNATTEDLFSVPPRFDARIPIQWVPVRALGVNEKRLAPAALCYAGVLGDAQSFVTADSIGCAAGRTAADAILSALLELIERDALAIWWYNRLRRPGIDLRAVRDPIVVASLREATADGLRVELLDLTHDLAVPVYVAIGTDADGRRPFVGCAAHLNPQGAARKALCEMLQLRFWATQTSMEPAYEAWLASGSLTTDEYLDGEDVVDLPPPSPVGDAAAALPSLVRRLHEHGLSSYAIELTRPEVGLPVFRALVPGLRHCWRRLAPGRLFEVPVRMGWLREPLSERELNPKDCPL